MASDLQTAITRYKRRVPPSLQTKLPEDLLNDVQSSVATGSMPGTVYNDWRQQIGREARSTSNPEQQQALYGLQRSLDDAMERSISASGNTQDLGALDNARKQYRDYLVVEKAAARGTGNSTVIIALRHPRFIRPLDRSMETEPMCRVPIRSLR